MDKVAELRFTILLHDISTSAATLLMAIVAAATYPDVVDALFVFWLDG